MKELVVISGKGGTGKTSLVASFAALAGHKVLADCDVDAADLHLVLAPSVQRQEEFVGGKRARIDAEACAGCGKCRDLCRFDAVEVAGGNGAEANFWIDPVACEGCGVCAWFCPEEAILMEDAVNGEWFVSETRHGPMVHARLDAAEENSGKLVTRIRQEARRLAEDQGLDLILIDGSPGIGCPVIASVSGVDLALVVVEPTLSGMHDFGRVAELASHFGIPAAVCVNRWDLNTRMTEQIEADALFRGNLVVGRVRYDPAVTRAQIEATSVVEYSQDGVSEDIRALWRRLAHALGQG